MSPTLVHNLQTWSGNFQHNVSDAFSQLSIHQCLRLVIIIGGYCLLRPYLIQLGGRFQAKDHERELDPDEASSDAAISPNSLRGHIVVPEDTDDEEDEDGSVNWGRRARRRQRQMVRRILEMEEKLRSEDIEADSDKEIEEFLIKDDS